MPMAAREGRVGGGDGLEVGFGFVIGLVGFRVEMRNTSSAVKFRA